MVTGTVALAQLGLPALGLVLTGIAIAAGVICWVLASQERSSNAERLIRAARLQPPVASSPPASALSGQAPVTARRRRARRREGASHG